MVDEVGEKAPGGDEAAEVFAAFAAEHAPADEEAFEALCREHPRLGPELREARSAWLGLRSVLGCGGARDTLGRTPSFVAEAARAARRQQAPQRAARLLRQLSERSSPFERYREESELGHGGMGVVLAAWDRDLGRTVAMKRLRGPRALEGTELEQRSVERFLEEAQVTGQLQHPGIVPVHDLGHDADGRLFFTMKRVEGETLAAVFRKAHTGADGWTVTRVVVQLLKVAEAMEYAHSKGVLHRDLKPANVMVGRFGEVYVMDWGLARLSRRADEDDDSRPLATYRHGGGASDGGSTLEGEVLGTPAYMSPEQAYGDLDALGPHSDVYSFGAMLYHLLCGHPPYLGPDERVHGHTVWRRLREGPPAPLARIAPKTSPELAAICEAAMARRIEDRLPDFRAVGDELRAFLEGRVVASYRTGPWMELVKWVRRNRATALALAALLLALVATGVVYGLGERRRFEARLPLIARSLIEEADRSWPATPDSEARIERFLESAVALRAHWDGSVPMLPPPSPEDAALRAAYVALLAEPDPDPPLGPSDVATIEHEIELLDDPEHRLRTAGSAPTDDAGLLGWLFAPEWGAVARARRRLQLLHEAGRVSLEDHAADWQRAIASIADRASCPAYDGLRIEPQWGLVPLERNPESGLWEFWHVPSGERPEPAGPGRWHVGPETGLVLVLVPAGRFHPWCWNVDRTPAYFSHPDEVVLEPYFISKYELTQGQWFSAEHTSPSLRPAGTSWGDSPRITRAHPVESVDWQECSRVLAHLGLVLPTEMQWEWAARAGSNDFLWNGGTLDPARVNLADQTFNAVVLQRDFGGRYDDGWPFHAPVDSFEPNPFGLHHAVGNVAEWCRDVWTWPLEAVRFEGPEGAAHGPNDFLYRAARGGSFRGELPLLTDRVQFRPRDHEEDVGARPARRLERGSW